MGEKLPVRIYLEEELIEALKEDAGKDGQMTYNEIAADIIARCRPIYLLAREAFGQKFSDFEEYFRQSVDLEARTGRKPK